MIAKRVFDVTVAATLLAATLPLFAAVAIAVRLDSPGPVLFAQTRIGRGGRPFRLLKFRSMTADAERRGGYSTMKHDPRITRVGRLIRAASLDELPQLLNVLRGDMSLVGPRPDVPAQRANYSESDWQERHSVRPGMTGLAQASLRSQATPEQRLALDLDYVRNNSLRRDLRILGLTIRRLAGPGAY